VPFPEGKHVAIIAAAKMDLSKEKGTPMIKLRIAGHTNEVAFYYLAFGNKMTEDNLGFLLASIEDNGVVIPDLDFGYNQKTVDFLIHKQVFIEVVNEKYKGKVRGNISRFLTKAEFTNGEVDSRPFQGQADQTWSDDEFNF
jgi:hypothetical protein